MKGASAKIAQELGSVDADGVGKDIGGKMGGGIVGTMKGLIGPALAIVGSGMFAGFIKDAAAASDATDKFVSTMSFAGMDTSAIDAAKNAAKSYADQTVYDLPTIQNMTAQLASNGVKDYTGLTQAAGNLNAVAGGNADTFKSVAMVMTQTAGAGKLTTENWNQMADAIPGAAGPLMKAMEDAGAYTGNFRDAMAAGQITSDEFNAALQKLGTDPIAVEAAKSTKTFEGAIGNLQATINSGLMSALNAMKPAITGAINLLSNGLGKAFEWTGNAAKGLHDLFVKGDFSTAFRNAFHVEEDSPVVGALFKIRDGVIKTLDLIHNFKAGLTGMVDANAFAGIADGPLKSFALLGIGLREKLQGIGDNLHNFKAGLSGAVSADAFAGIADGPLKSFALLGAGMHDKLQGIFDNVHNFKAGLTGDLDASAFASVSDGPLKSFALMGIGVRDKLQGVRDIMHNFVSGLKGDVDPAAFAGVSDGPLKTFALLGDGIRDAIGKIGPVIGPLIPQFLGLFSAISPLGTVFQVIQPLLPQLLDVFVQLAVVVGQSLGTALTTLVPLFIQLQAVFISVFQQVLATALPVIVQLVTMLGQTFAQLLPILMPIVTTIVELAVTLISQLMPIFMQLVSAVLPMVVTIFGALLQAIGPVIGMIAGLLIPIIQALMPTVVTVFGIIAQVITSVMTIIMGIIQVVTGIISGNWAQVWSGMLNILSGIFGLIVNLISGAIQMVISIIGGGLGVVSGVFFSIWSGIVGYLTTAFRSIVNGASGMLGDLVGFFGSIGGTVLGALGNIGGTLIGSGRALIQGFIDGIKGMIGSVGDAVGSVLDFAKQFFPHSPAKRGPFSGSGYTSFSGQALARDFAAGIASQNDAVADAAAGIMTSASLTGHVGISSALQNGAGARGSTTINNTINQVDDPIGTAHAIARRQVALAV